MSEWQTSEHVEGYLGRADALPHREEGEAVMFYHIPPGARRILDVGSGAGRLISLLKRDRPQASYVAIDFSPAMMEKFLGRYAGDASVTLVEHDLGQPLPDLGRFDAVVSSFAIHHCTHPRKRSLYAEIFRLLEPGGIFCNLEHVASPNDRMHRAFFKAMGYGLETEDPSNKLLDVPTQLGWLRETGFEDVDCYWKWLEFALLCGVKPA